MAATSRTPLAKKVAVVLMVVAEVMLFRPANTQDASAWWAVLFWLGVLATIAVIRLPWDSQEPQSERIVRSLANCPPPIDSEVVACLLCDEDLILANADVSYDPSDHKPECPWRLAREWAEANCTVTADNLYALRQADSADA